MEGHPPTSPTSEKRERSGRNKTSKVVKKRKDSLRAVARLSGVSMEAIEASLSFHKVNQLMWKARSQTVGAFAKCCVDRSISSGHDFFYGERERWCSTVRSYLSFNKQRRLVRNNVNLLTSPTTAAEQMRHLWEDQFVHQSSSWDRPFLRIAAFVKKQTSRVSLEDRSVFSSIKIASIIKQNDFSENYTIRSWFPQTRSGGEVKFCYSSTTEIVNFTDLLVGGMRVRGGRWFSLSESDVNLIECRLQSWCSLLCPRVQSLRQRARRSQYEEALTSGFITMNRYLDDYISEISTPTYSAVSLTTHTLTLLFRPEEPSVGCWQTMRSFFPNLRSLQLICYSNTPPLKCSFYYEYLSCLGDLLPPTVSVLQITGFALHAKYVENLLTKANSQLQMLILSKNWLTDDSAFHICSLLESSHHLSYLDISDNSFYEDGMRILCQGLLSNNSLTYLDVSRNPHEQDSLLQSLMVPKEDERPGWVRHKHHLIESRQRNKIRPLAYAFYRIGVELDLLLHTLEYLTVYSRVLPLRIVCDLPSSYKRLRRVHTCNQSLPTFSMADYKLNSILSKMFITTAVTTAVVVCAVAALSFRLQSLLQRPVPPKRCSVATDKFQYRRWKYSQPAAQVK